MSDVPTARSADLVGRDAELEDLTSRLGIRAPGATTSYAVLLSGDAGVGKTRLLTELRDVALGEGWLVLAGHCLDLADGSLPYVAFSEILGRILAERPEVAASVTERHPTLARLQPGRRLRATDDRDEDQSLDRGNIFAAFHDLLESLAEEGPLLVVVEDAHWADQSTRDMLELPVLPPVRGTGATRRVLPLRRPAPSPPPATAGGGVGPPAGGRAAAGRAAHRRRRASPRLPRSTRTRRSARRASPRSSTGPRATRSSSRSSSAPRGPPGDTCRPSSPTCCWCASTGSTTAPARWCGWPASPGVTSPTSCSRRSPGSGPPTSRGRCGAPSSPTSSPRRGPRPTPSATRCWGRRSTTTCCPASAPACTPPSARRSPRARRPAPRPSWPCTRVGPVTGSPRCAPASRPATRPSRSAVPTRRRCSSSRRSTWWRASRRSPTTSTCTPS